MQADIVSAIVSSVLSKYFKMLVKNWVRDKMQFRLVKGHCCLTNLELYEGVLQNAIKMPYMEVKSAVISTLDVYIAVDKIKQEPVRIVVEKLEVIMKESAEPILPSSPLHEFFRRKKEKSAARALAGKQKKKKKKKGYSKVDRILDGLSVDINYLDVSISTGSCLIKVLLEKFSLHNTNSNWEVVSLQESLPRPPKDNPAAAISVFRECQIGGCTVAISSHSDRLSYVKVLDALPIVVRIGVRRGPGFQQTSFHLVLDKPLKTSITPEGLMLVLRAVKELGAIAKKKVAKTELAKQQERQQADFQTFQNTVEEEPIEGDLALDESSSSTDSEPLSTPEQPKPKVKTVYAMELGAHICQLQLEIHCDNEQASAGSQKGITAALYGLELRINSSQKLLDFILPYAHIFTFGHMTGRPNSGGPNSRVTIFEPVMWVKEKQVDPTVSSGSFYSSFWPHLARSNTQPPIDFAANMPTLSAFRSQLGGDMRHFFRLGSEMLRISKSTVSSSAAAMVQLEAKLGAIKILLDICALQHALGPTLDCMVAGLGKGADDNFATKKEPRNVATPLKDTKDKDKDKPKKESTFSLEVGEISLLVPANTQNVKRMPEMLLINFRHLQVKNHHSPVCIGEKCLPLGEALTPELLDECLQSCDPGKSIRVTCKAAISIISGSAEQQQQPLLLPVLLALDIYTFKKQRIIHNHVEAIQIVIDQDQSIVLAEIVNSYRYNARGESTSMPFVKTIKEMMKMKKPKAVPATPIVPKGSFKLAHPLLQELGKLSIFNTIDYFSVEAFYPTNDGVQGNTVISLVASDIRQSQLKRLRYFALKALKISTSSSQHPPRPVLVMKVPKHEQSKGIVAALAYSQRICTDGSKKGSLHICGVEIKAHASHLSAMLGFATKEAPIASCSPWNVFQFYTKSAKKDKKKSKSKEKKVKTKKTKGAKELKLCIQHTDICILEKVTEDTCIGLRIRDATFSNPNTSKPVAPFVSGEPNSFSRPGEPQSSSPKVHPLAQKLYKVHSSSGGRALEVLQCSIICKHPPLPNSVPKNSDSFEITSPTTKKSKSKQIAESIVVEPFDVSSVSMATVGKFVEELTSDPSNASSSNGLGLDQFSDEIFSWLPEGLHIKILHPRVYSRISAIMRNFKTDMKEVKGSFKKLKTKKPIPVPTSTDEKWTTIVANSLNDLRTDIQATDDILLQTVRAIGHEEGYHIKETQSLLVSAREYLGESIPKAISNIEPLVRDEVLIKAAQETRSLEADIRRLEAEKRVYQNATNTKTHGLVRPLSQARMSSDRSPKKSDVSYAMLQEQNMLYRELLAEHAQANRLAEAERDEITKRNFALLQLLAAHDIPVPRNRDLGSQSPGHGQGPG